MNNDEKISSGIYKKGEICYSDIIKSLKKNPNFKKAGAILTFTGVVRSSSLNGKEVMKMQIDAYDELANKNLEKICTELMNIPGIIDIKIVHLKGEFTISEDLVHVVLASAHREEGFEVLRLAIERYKKELAVWKKEIYSDGSSEWIH